MTVAVADDHVLILDGLGAVIPTIEGVSSLYKALDYGDLQRLLSEVKIDVLFLDIHFGKFDGREIISKIKQQQPELKIVALTSNSEQTTVKTALASGFDGFILKIDGREEIKNAIHAVLRNETYISEKAQGLNQGSGYSAEETELTHREKEILQLIVQEKTTKEISELLFLSEKTIESHRGNIMIKLGVRNIAGMVRKAIMKGIIKLNND
jgi:DNA-binding NarL/FixJ family response regulator